MTRARLIGIATMMCLALTATAPAQSVDDLMKEFKGETPAQNRAPDALQAAYAQVIDVVAPDIGGTDLTKRAAAQTGFEQICLRAGRPNAEVERAALAKALAAKLGPTTPPKARVWFLRMLQHIGRAEVVPVLVQTMGDKDAEVADCARRALQHNRSDEAGAALREALTKATAAEAQVGLVNALGVRKDAAATAAIAKFVSNGDATLATAAAIALGKIANEPATAALSAARATAAAGVKPAVIDAYLICAEALVAQKQNDKAYAMYAELYQPAESVKLRIAALRGVLLADPAKGLPLAMQALRTGEAPLKSAAARFLVDVPGTEVTKALVEEMAKATPELQVLLLGALGGRGDVAGKPAALAALKSDDESVRTAAAKALATVGDASCILPLAQAAAAGAGESQSARESLGRLKGTDVNAAIVAAIPGAGAGADAKVRAELIRALGDRGAAEAVDALVKGLGEPDETVRTAAMSGLSTIGDPKALPALVKALAAAKSDAERNAASDAVVAVARKVSDENKRSEALLAELPASAMPNKGALLRTLGRVGGSKALEAVRAAAKDANAEVMDAGIRALAVWPDDAAAGEALEIAKTAAKDNHKILALQGYIRMAGLASDKPAEQLKMYEQAMSLARRAEEKRGVLAGLADMTGLGAFKLAAASLADDSLKNEAARAVVKIGASVARSNADDVRAAVQKVLEVVKNDNRLRNDADKLLRSLPAARR